MCESRYRRAHNFDFRSNSTLLLPLNMIFQAQITDALAIIGLASSLLVVTSMAKLLIALKRHGDFGSAITSRPPRDAYKSKVFWITGASSGIVSHL